MLENLQNIHKTDYLSIENQTLKQEIQNLKS